MGSLEAGNTQSHKKAGADDFQSVSMLFPLAGGQHARIETSSQVFLFHTLRLREEALLDVPFGNCKMSENQHWICSSVNTPTFQEVLEHFAADTSAGVEREIVLVVDGAGWHTTPQLRTPPGLHLVFLPPYSPELQPAERLWQLTDQPLKNRYFESLTALQEVLEKQCAWLEGQWERVKGLTGFYWWPFVTN